MTPAEGARGRRLGLVRRLLAAFEGKDLPAPVFAARLAKDKKAIYRYERGEIKPPGETVDRIVELCAAAGLPMITAEWIERGRGGAAALGDIRIPETVLETNVFVELDPEEEHRLVAEPAAASTYAEKAAAAKKTARTRRARGGE